MPIFIGFYALKQYFKFNHLYILFFKKHISQGKWLLFSSVIQWWSSNLFVVASGVFLGLEALGAFRLVQTVFGVLNLLFQTFENYVLPKAVSLFVKSTNSAKKYIISISKKSGLLILSFLFVLYIFSDSIIQLIGGEKYTQYGFVIRGMSILYVLIFIGYPIRLCIRMLVLNKNFFIGYLLSLAFSLLFFNYFLSNFGLSGAILGLVISQLILIIYWQFVLSKNNFLLWK
jgi:O-antigen/teichoic acid export membrane protein